MDPITTAFDPSAPLPGPPDPWDSTHQPGHRDGPPFHMTEMIEAEPAFAGRLLRNLASDSEAGQAARRLAAEIDKTAAAGLPILVTGCGTSEHGALGAADLLRDALRRAGLPHSTALPIAVQAFELALDPPMGGLVIGVSHEGGTWATNRAIDAARAAGATVALITVSARSPGAALTTRGLVIETAELDQSWCHTIGYLAPLLAAYAVGELVAGATPTATADAVEGALAGGVGEAPAAEAVAAALGDVTRIIVIGSGADRVAGRELALKLEEGTWIPSAYRDLETMLHGHWPGTDATTGLVLFLADRSARAERLARARQLLAGAREIGIKCAAIVAATASVELDPELTPAGRIVVAEQPLLPPPAAALFATATPLQLLTERLARVRGTNPDPIRRGDPVYRAAGAAAEA